MQRGWRVVKVRRNRRGQSVDPAIDDGEWRGRIVTQEFLFAHHLCVLLKLERYGAVGPNHLLPDLNITPFAQRFIRMKIAQFKLFRVYFRTDSRYVDLI